METHPWSKRYYWVYFLQSMTRKNWPYVGISVDPAKRLKSHNRPLEKGRGQAAMRTYLAGPWEMVMKIEGFKGPASEQLEQRIKKMVKDRYA